MTSVHGIKVPYLSLLLRPNLKVTGQEIVSMSKIGTSVPVVVYIVDDDRAVREGLTRLLKSAGMDPRPYQNPEDFLAEVENRSGACILLDITMPRMTGLNVQAKLNERAIVLPVITVSAREDENTRASAHSLGARLFLRKPVDDQALLDAIIWVVGTK